MSDLHPTLIRANVALYAGDYAEVRRLLADYRAEGGGAAEHAPMAIWLDAHAQSEPDERLRRLDTLVTAVAPDNLYAKMAQAIIDLERADTPDIPTGSGARRVIIGGLIVVVALIVIAAALLSRTAPEQIADAPPTATLAPTAAPLPDRSRPLAADTYTARYAGGILQVTAVEDAAARVIDRDGAQVQPVPGARFFAVELAFECRIAICQRPPEADVTLRLADDSIILPAETFYIQNESPLSPVALGVTTRGWMVFQIPSIIAVSSLDVTAPDAEGVNITTEIPLE